jgi:hypothetical protein
MQWGIIFQSAQTIAAIAAGAAAIWAAYDARRSRKVAESAVRPEPVITASMFVDSPYDDCDASIIVTIRNRADVALTVCTAILNVSGFELTTGGKEMDCDLHVERVREGSEENERILVLELARIASQEPPHRASIALRMRWQDHAASALAMNVTIVQPMLKAASQ